MRESVLSIKYKHQNISSDKTSTERPSISSLPHDKRTRIKVQFCGKQHKDKILAMLAKIYHVKLRFSLKTLTYAMATCFP